MRYDLEHVSFLLFSVSYLSFCFSVYTILSKVHSDRNVYPSAGVLLAAKQLGSLEKWAERGTKTAGARNKSPENGCSEAFTGYDGFGY